MESISLLSRKMRLLNELVPAFSFSSKATTYLLKNAFVDWISLDCLLHCVCSGRGRSVV